MSGPTPMSGPLTKSADIQGMGVLGLEGVKLGSARELFVDLADGKIGFLIVEAGGLLGGAGKFHPVPWTTVRYDAHALRFHVDVTKDAFKGSPSYDREQLANASYGWDEQARRYFGASHLA